MTYVATDSAGYQAFCASAVTVQDTTPPTITCPAPITLECTDENGVPVDDAEIRAWIATATASDTCGDVTITNDAPPFLPPGCGPGQETVVTFTATDDCGLQEVCTSTITVVDPPPVITSCGDAEECLWPANHKYVCIEGFSIDLGIEDACGDAFLVDVECTSSQCDDAPCSEFPDDKGDGHTTNDCFYDVATDTLCARAERAGNQKEGRYYSVTAIAGDDCGPTSPQLVLTIWVPHDKREAKGCRSPE